MNNYKKLLRYFLIVFFSFSAFVFLLAHEEVLTEFSWEEFRAASLVIGAISLVTALLFFYCNDIYAPKREQKQFLKPPFIDLIRYGFEFNKKANGYLGYYQGYYCKVSYQWGSGVIVQVFFHPIENDHLIEKFILKKLATKYADKKVYWAYGYIMCVYEKVPKIDRLLEQLEQLKLILKKEELAVIPPEELDQIDFQSLLQKKDGFQSPRKVEDISKPWYVRYWGISFPFILIWLVRCQALFEMLIVPLLPLGMSIVVAGLIGGYLGWQKSLKYELNQANAICFGLFVGCILGGLGFIEFVNHVVALHS